MFTGDDRGQSIQIGAVLLFGMLILALTIYQATIVPQQNKQVEFDHSQAVQEDLQQLRNSIVRVTADAQPLPQTVALGVMYPNRFIAVNPSPPSGTIRTTNVHNVTVDGYDRTACYGQGTGGGAPQGAETRLLTYEANYNVYSQAPTLVYENTVIHKQFVDPAKASKSELEKKTIPMSGQRLVDGNRIHLVSVVGSYQQSGVDMITVEPRVGPTRRTAVTNPTITLPTRMSQSEWDSLLGADGTIVSYDQPKPADTVGEVEIQFSGRYVISCSLVSLNGASMAPSQTQASMVENISSPAPELYDGELSFRIKNNGSNQVTVTGFSLANESTQYIRADGTNDEVTVDPNQGRTAIGNVSDGPLGSGFKKGIEYDFIRDSDYNGQSGVILRNKQAKVTITTLRNESGDKVGPTSRPALTLEYTTPGSATISVTLVFGDGSKETFYFKPQ